MKLLWDNEVRDWVEPSIVHAKKARQRKSNYDFPTPAVIRDIADYISPIDDTVIHGRAGKREHMAKHDVVDWEPLGGKNSVDRDGYRNPKFAKRRGLKLSERGRKMAEMEKKNAT